jgi:hypothetical protein
MCFYLQELFVIPLGLEPLALPILIGMLYQLSYEINLFQTLSVLGVQKYSLTAFTPKKLLSIINIVSSTTFSNERGSSSFKITFQFIGKAQF